MKKIKINYFQILAAGLLFMNGGDLINHFIALNPDFNDFLKGMGFSIILTSLWIGKKKTQKKGD